MTSKDFNQVYEVSEPGYFQIDVKYVPTSICKGDKRIYIYNAIDNYSRFSFSYAYEDKCVSNSLDFLSRLNEKCLALGLVIKEVQTDNGTEFVHSYHKRRGKYAVKYKLSAFEVLAINFGFNATQTRVATSQHNGKIERFHRTINHKLLKKFLKYKKRLSIKDFNHVLFKYNNFNNKVRIHRKLNNIPLTVLQNYLHFGIVSEHIFKGTFIRYL